MQAEDGGSVYLRLTTRAVDQPARAGDDWIPDALKGAYWQVPPSGEAELAIVYAGAVAPEAAAAHAELIDDVPGAGLLAVPSADLLHRDWVRAQASRWTSGERHVAHADALLSQLSARAGLVTVIDGAPSTLSWLGSVRGHRVAPLGVEAFGQSGDIVDLYETYRLDTGAILDACAQLFVTSN